MNQFKS